jgi:putative aldouronate transport system substrate-binding protein
MMKRMKKWISMLTVSTIALSLAACGGTSSKKSESSASDVDTLVSEYGFQWTDTSAPILNDAGAEAISFTVYSSKNASALDYNDMKIMQDLFEMTNVTVNWENVSESVYSQQKNLIFGNSDDRPDAIYHAGMTSGEIIKYAKRNVLVAISDYLEYMPNFSKILEERPDIKSQLINEEDGKIYSLPRIEEMGLLQNPNLLFLNKNWAAEAIEAGAVDGLTTADLVDGLDLTSDQMESLLRYFKDNDMNGNGDTSDERPLSFVYNNWQGNQCDLYGMFGLNDNLEHRVIVDGEVTYTVQDERFKEATNYIAGWVSEGLIDKVSFEISQDNFLANGKGTETYGAFYWWESETVVSNPEDYIVCDPIIGPNGDQTICVSNNPEVSTGELVFFSDCENIEVLLAYFDRYYDPVISAQINYGPIGIVYEEETDEDGKLVQKEISEDITADELRLQNAPLGIIYLSDDAWENVVNMEPRAQLRKERLDSYATPFVSEGVSPCVNLTFTLEELNVLSNYETNISDYINTNLIKWLMNGGVSDDDWDAFQADLTGKTNLTEVRQVYQDAYDRSVSGS